MAGIFADVSAPTQSGNDLLDWLRQRALMVLAIGAWVFTFAGIATDRLAPNADVLPTVLFIVAYLSGGTLAAIDAFRDLRRGQINVDLLMVLAAAGAAVLGQWAEGAILLSLFSTSNALEHYSMGRTRDAVKALMDITPPTARVDRGDALLMLPVADVQVGDVVVIQPGERIPVDATITEGRSSIDQSTLTGESIPVDRAVGDSIFAGTVNGNGALRATVTRLSTDSTISRIVRLVADAREDQSKLQEFAEGFEGKYAVFVIAFSSLVTLVPMLLGADAGEAFYRGMTLLVVLSPCALVISTPAATLSALANAARKGILIKGGRAMEALGRVDTIALDKTGTVTWGVPHLTDIVTTGRTNARDLLGTVAAAEQLSEHPIGRAIVEAAIADGLTLPEGRDVEAIPGHGIVARVARERIAIGNGRLMALQHTPIPTSAQSHQQRLSDEGKSTMFVAIGGEVRGVLAVADVVRPDVPHTIQRLRGAGVKRIVMLTGDNERVAAAIAAQVGIDDVRADLLPEEKLTAINELRQHGRVAMIGDGVNDAPALATADVGIAMGGTGSDAALETADVVLMSDDLARVGYAIGLSRSMRRVITFNLAFALSVIAVLATTTLVIGIPLPLGVVGHEGSTVIVILNGLRLLGYGGGWKDVVHRQNARPAVQETHYQVLAT